MIYLSDIRSIIESIYLEEPLGDEVKSCGIFINPDRPTYLAGKTVILNDFDYPEEKVDTLLKNKCTVISRVPYRSTEIIYKPYLHRPNFGIIWNGDSVSSVESVKDLMEYSTFDIGRRLLLFPKLSNKLIESCRGEHINYLGWALHQVGDESIPTGSIFKDLDLLKTKKIIY